MGGVGGNELAVGATGDVHCTGAGFLTLAVNGLAFKPVAVVCQRVSGSNTADVLGAAILPPVAFAYTYSQNYRPNVTGYSLTDDGFTISISVPWGWGSYLRWYAYTLQQGGEGATA